MDTEMSPANDAIFKIFQVYEKSRTMDYIGEGVSQLEHALQCAKIAQDSGANTEEILAVLLHDIGHIWDPYAQESMGEFGVAHHEIIGAEILAQLGFSKKICELVRGHVDAKRYLVFRNKKYGAQLSEASQRTLEYQGGPMTEEEAASFEKDPLFKEKLRVRAWDEQGKKPNWQVPQLESYRDLFVSHLRGHADSPSSSNRPKELT